MSKKKQKIIGSIFALFVPIKLNISCNTDKIEFSNKYKSYLSEKDNVVVFGGSTFLNNKRKYRGKPDPK